MDVAKVEKIEAELDNFIERRAREARDGRSRANEEAAHQRAADARRGVAARLVNARAWCEFYGGLSLRHHDLAAENAAKRDEYAALVRELQETNERKSA